MHDFTHLKFPDEETARKVTGWWDEQNGWPQPSTELEIAVRGEIYAGAAEYDANGVLIKAPVLLEGWHIDVISGVIPPAAEPYIINPSASAYTLA